MFIAEIRELLRLTEEVKKTKSNPPTAVSSDDASISLSACARIMEIRR